MEVAFSGINIYSKKPEAVFEFYKKLGFRVLEELDERGDPAPEGFVDLLHRRLRVAHEDERGGDDGFGIRFRLDLPEREQRGAQIVAGEILPRVRNGVAESFIELFHEGDGERLLRWEVVRERSLRQSQARGHGGERRAAIPAFGDL